MALGANAGKVNKKLETLACLEREPGKRTDITTTLSDIGQGSEYATALEDSRVTRQDAHRWQAIASLPEEVFEEYVRDRIEKEEELTSSGALRLAMRRRAQHPKGHVQTRRYER